MLMHNHDLKREGVILTLLFSPLSSGSGTGWMLEFRQASLEPGQNVDVEMSEQQDPSSLDHHTTAEQYLCAGVIDVYHCQSTANSKM